MRNKCFGANIVLENKRKKETNMRLLPNNILPLLLKFSSIVHDVPLVGLAGDVIGNLLNERINDDDALFSVYSLIYMKAAESTFRHALNSGIDRTFFIGKRKEALIKASSYFVEGSPYRFMPSSDQDREYSFFYNVFTDWLNLFNVRPVFSQELNKVIQNAQSRAHTYTRSLLRARDIFEAWYDNQQNNMPFARVVPDSIEIRPNEIYLEQHIDFALSDGDDKRKIAAKADNGKAGEWWQEIRHLLQANNYFLHGCGGMGKSNFLRRLYKEVKDKNKGVPYQRVIFVSFYSVSTVTLDNSTAGPILRQIATLAGNALETEAWHKILSDQSEYAKEHPVLLLLDGLNEMIGRGTSRREMTLREMTKLTDRNEYPNLHIIFSSRVEHKREYDELKNTLMNYEVNYLEAEIHGLTINLDNLCTEFDGEMKELYKRPLYYLAFEEKIKDNSGGLPKTRYAALGIMYDALCKQFSKNTPDAMTPQIRECAYKYILPEIANKLATLGTISFDSNLHSSTQRMVSNLLENTYTEVDRSMLSTITEFLKKQEQIIIYDKSTGFYRFTHQDYGDYLAAVYYYQRIELMNSGVDNNCHCYPDWTNECAFLDIAKYSNNIISLIYEAVNIKEKAAPPYVAPNITADGFTRQHFLCLYTIYQIEDWCHLKNINNENLWRNTLMCLQPFESSLLDPYRPVSLYKIKEKLAIDETRELDKIVLKIVELHRRLREFDKAYSVLALFDPSLPKTKHNRAKLMLAQVQNGDLSQEENNKLIYDALSMLLDCCNANNITTPRQPYRFSSNLLAMILTSPQPFLRRSQAYSQFIMQKIGTTPTYISAFWILYDAVYRNDPDRGQWRGLYYTARQMLRLLAENKVTITVDDKEHFMPDALHEMIEAGTCHIALGRSPVPTGDNIFVMDRMFAPFQAFPDRQTRVYLKTLIYYYTGGVEKALSLFNVDRLGSEDVRSQLWYYYLIGDSAGCKQCYEENAQNIQFKTDFDLYNPKEYFLRDVGQLYDYLIGRGDEG